MSLLSRSAWQLLWIGRLLERAEGTARAVWSMHMMDTYPKSRGLATWQELLSAYGQEEGYVSLRGEASDNRSMMRFAVGSRENPNSMAQLVRAMRDNMRTVRGHMPEELWHYSTDLVQLAETAARSNESTRYDALDRFIQLCRASAGATKMGMRRDEAYSFWQIGRRLETAETTSRMLLWTLSEEEEDPESDDDEAELQTDNIRWLFVLKSMGLTGSFFAGVRAAVTGARTIDFLVNDGRLPSSVKYSMADVRDQLERLPSNERTLGALATASQAAAKISGSRPDCQQRLERLLGQIGRVSTAIDATYFPQFK